MSELELKIFQFSFLTNVFFIDLKILVHLCFFNESFHSHV